LPTALGDLDAVHRDHLHCERKAAQSALSLVRFRLRRWTI
jgi:tRNA isopentenyl-2-thiomethyl-A-37 hydroxylase MiaE